jgi:hypothetical protein
MTAPMSTRDVNSLNIGLMVLSALLAWEHPAALFFFAYGVLGPLHYLTEISWLHERGWFATSRRDAVWPSIVALLLTGLHVSTTFFGKTSPVLGTPPAEGGTGFFLGAGDFLVWSAVGSTVAAAFVAGGGRKTLVAIGVCGAGLLVAQTHAGRVFSGVFLATLVHVYFFTACFILYGALKTKSVSGYVSLAVHAGCGALLLFAPDGAAIVSVSASEAERLGSFLPVLQYTSLSLGRTLQGPEGQEGLKNALRFMAYAYTYHYLNWFSKTGFIRWHEMPKRRAIGVVVAWLGSAGLYLYDWRTGFTALLALSLAHVFLEFPLNWRTFVGIGQELRARIGPRGPSEKTIQSPATAR